MKGSVSGRKRALGNAAIITYLDLDLADIASHVNTLRDAGKTAMFVAIDGIVTVVDPIKAIAEEAICILHDLSLRIIMATGNNERTARAVIQKLGSDEVSADMLPESKKALVDELHAKDEGVAMAGDGINYAPALATADVGITMVTGADVTLESAGIALVKGDLSTIVRARKLAQETIRNIKQNWPSPSSTMS